MRGSKKDNRKHKNDDEEDSENDHDDDKSDNSDVDNTDNSPKSIPVGKLPDRLKSKKIVINISDTQYPIVEEIAEELGWVIQRKQGSGNWDLWWTDREIHPDTLIKMHFHQKINHYPGIEVLARKNLLGLNLMAMKDHFPEQYNFFPDTWTIPLEFPKFRAYFESCPKGKIRTFIVKPEALSQGRGIFLTRNIEDIATGHKYVVQRYIKRPYLIDGLKFDLRIYVLLAGSDPLRLYIYEEGLTRLATKKYEQANDQNMSSAYIHLTNYSLNKNNPNFIYNTSVQNMDVGHKRTLSFAYSYLAKRGHDVDKLKAQINDLIIKTMISGVPTIAHQYQACQPEDYQGNMCFHILGVDVMITQDLKPYLIEINHTPSFQTDTPLDVKVKKSLIVDTLKLMRITGKKKKQLFEKAKVTLKKRIQTGKRDILKGEERKQLVKIAQELRDRQQADKMGGYKQIYPCKDSARQEQYDKMIERAEDVHKSTQQQRRKLIRQEQDQVKLAKKAASQQPEKQADTKKPKSEKDGRHFHSTSLNDKPRDMAESVPTPTRKPTPNRRPIPETAPKLEQEPTHNMMMGGRTNSIIRKKNRMLLPTVDPAQQREEIVKLSDYMQKHLVNSTKSTSKIAPSANSLPDICNYYSNIHHFYDRHKNEVTKQEKIKQGSFITPKTYSIVSAQHSSIEKMMVAQNRQSNADTSQKKPNLNPIASQCRNIRVLEAYKFLHRKKKEDPC